jgi:type I restriction enzyme, S subunit
MNFGQIGDVALKVDSWNPIRDGHDQLIDYIDLSSIDQDTKTIQRNKPIVAKEAPSRARQLIQEGDVLVSTVRPNLNGVAMVDKSLDGATASTGFCVLRPNVKKLDGSYLFHWVKTSEFISDMVRKSTGASYPAVSDRIILESKIPLPPIAEQKRIAAILDKAEEVRSQRRQALEQLDAIGQSIFLEMFGDPVANEKGWKFAKISDFVSAFETGKNIVASDEDDITSNYRVLKVSAITSLEYRPEEAKAVPDNYQPPKSHFVRTGDLLFSRANTSELVGATAYVFKTPKDILLPDKIWRFVWHDEPQAEPLFVWFLFQHPAFRYEISKRATGTSGSMKNISQGKVFSIRVGLPPIALQQEFARRVETIAQLKTIHRESLAQLDALFASLQHRAFRGEL